METTNQIMTFPVKVAEETETLPVNFWYRDYLGLYHQVRVLDQRFNIDGVPYTYQVETLSGEETLEQFCNSQYAGHHNQPMQWFVSCGWVAADSLVVGDNIRYCKNCGNVINWTWENSLGDDSGPGEAYWRGECEYCHHAWWPDVPGDENPVAFLTAGWDDASPDYDIEEF